jgi:hypothetical protein
VSSTDGFAIALDRRGTKSKASELKSPSSILSATNPDIDLSCFRIYSELARHQSVIAVEDYKARVQICEDYSSKVPVVRSPES